jgi:hypothetical protein
MKKLVNRIAKLEAAPALRPPSPMVLALEVPDGPDLVYLSGEWKWVECPDAEAILADRPPGLKLYRGLDPREIWS